MLQQQSKQATSSSKMELQKRMTQILVCNLCVVLSLYFVKSLCFFCTFMFHVMHIYYHLHLFTTTDLSTPCMQKHVDLCWCHFRLLLAAAAEISSQMSTVGRSGYPGQREPWSITEGQWPRSTSEGGRHPPSSTAKTSRHDLTAGTWWWTAGHHWDVDGSLQLFGGCLVAIRHQMIETYSHFPAHILSAYVYHILSHIVFIITWTSWVG